MHEISNIYFKQNHIYNHYSVSFLHKRQFERHNFELNILRFLRLRHRCCAIIMGDLQISGAIKAQNQIRNDVKHCKQYTHVQNALIDGVFVKRVQFQHLIAIGQARLDVTTDALILKLIDHKRGKGPFQQNNVRNPLNVVGQSVVIDKEARTKT